MADLAQPLNSRMPVVNSDGIPTEFFIQWAQQFSKETEDELLVKVEGPASSTDTAIARFDGTTGQLLKDSIVTIDDTGTTSGIATLNTTGPWFSEIDNATLYDGSIYSDSTFSPRLSIRRARGTSSAPSQTLANDFLGLYEFRGHTGTAFTNSSAVIRVRATQDGSVGRGGKIEFLTTPNGAGTFPALRLTIDQDGLITSQNDIVVPDEAYGSSWDGSLEVPTKNAVYDKIETMGGGGGGGSLVFIGEVVAAGGETDLTIGSIASTYRDLFFVFSARCSAGNGEIGIRLNGDTSGVYDAYRHYGGFANSGDQAVNQTRLRIAFSNTVANRFVAGEGKVYKYADTGRHKQVTGEATSPDGSSATNGYIFGFGGQWRSTAAVTSISLISLTQPFAAGSHFTVYGRT